MASAQRSGAGAKSLARPVALALAVLIADQATKAAATHWLPLGQPFPVLNGVLWLTRIANRGAAFGLFPAAAIYVLIMLAACALLLLFLLQGRWIQRAAARPPLALLLGGSLGNLVDRLRLGYVVDFLDLRIWPVFNLADVALSVGAVWLVVLLLRAKGQS